MRIDINDLSKEIDFQATRSGGPGGQNVNKVNSKVILRLDIPNSQVLDEKDKKLLLRKLKSRINKDGHLVISEQRSRSQLKNKEEAINKLESLLRKAFEKKKPRLKTKPSKAAKEKRLLKKKRQSEKKQMRKDIL